MFADWSLWMQSHGLTADEAEAHFAQWANEDHYVPIGAELGLVFDAGFPRPEYFWRQGGIAVYGGFKDS